MEEKVAAYITLYEDKEASIKCLQALKSQTVPVDSIFIVDNSKEKLFENFDDPSLLIHCFPSNIGISQGLILAFKWAIKENYSFLWTFDQDSIPSPDCLFALLEEYQNLIQQNNKVGIVAPIAFDKRSQSVIGGVNFTNNKFTHCKYDESITSYECDAPILSGSLIDLAAAKITEFPLGDLFMDGMDFDYGLKLKKQGFKNFVVTKAKLEHNYSNPINLKILNFAWVFHSYSPLRYYYSCRNTTYLAINYSKGFYKVTSALHRIKTMLLKIVAIAFLEETNKPQKIYACLLGTYHGFIRKLGKLWH
jgi:rhamnosyltransferase